MWLKFLEANRFQRAPEFHLAAAGRLAGLSPQRIRSPRRLHRIASSSAACLASDSGQSGDVNEAAVASCRSFARSVRGRDRATRAEFQVEPGPDDGALQIEILAAHEACDSVHAGAHRRPGQNARTWRSSISTGPGRRPGTVGPPPKAAGPATRGA